jgi:excisionase family DNA binding protein
LLRVREIADVLAVSTMTVYRLINAGELRAIRIGRAWRVPGAELDAYLTRGRAS